MEGDPNKLLEDSLLNKSHAIDLFRWFLGELKSVSCITSRLFFKEQPLDEGGMAIFESNLGANASLHTTPNGKSSIRSFCENGYIIIDGLGSSYGTEKLIVGKKRLRWPFR